MLPMPYERFELSIVSVRIALLHFFSLNDSVVFCCTSQQASRIASHQSPFENILLHFAVIQNSYIYQSPFEDQFLVNVADQLTSPAPPAFSCLGIDQYLNFCYTSCLILI